MKENKTTITTFLFSLISYMGMALVLQGPPPPQPPPPVGLPIDGSLGILIVIGLLYGISRLLKLKYK